MPDLTDDALQEHVQTADVERDIGNAIARTREFGRIPDTPVHNRVVRNYLNDLAGRDQEVLKAWLGRKQDDGKALEPHLRRAADALSVDLSELRSPASTYTAAHAERDRETVKKMMAMNERQLKEYTEDEIAKREQRELAEKKARMTPDEQREFERQWRSRL